LKRMIDDGVVFTAGRGGPGDPQRYFLHPLLGGALGWRPLGGVERGV
jgi:hypothetical protein